MLLETIEVLRHGNDSEVLGSAVQPNDEWFIQGYETYTWYRAIGEAVMPFAILELGVRFGYAGLALLKGAAAAGRQAHYVGIDNEQDGIRSNAIALANLMQIDPEAEILHLNTRNVYAIGVELAKRQRDYDIVHVDADHSPSGIAAELTIAERWVERKDGCILVDDIDTTYVREAVQQFCGAHGLKPIVIPTHHKLYLIPMNRAIS